MLWRGLLALTLALWGVSSVAQDVVPRSQILTIDSSRLFPETLLGQSIITSINEERRAFAIENQAIAEQFRAEELALTEQRATLPRDEFARLAEDFDRRAQAERAERDAEMAAFERRAQAQERGFLQQIQPVLGQIMADAGALVLIESGTVILRNEAIDVTDIAIARINAASEISTPEEGAGAVDPVISDQPSED